MRKWLSILFVLSLTAPFVGVFGWLSMEKHLLRKEIKHELMASVSDEELKPLSFKKEDTLLILNWEHAKEFEYKGEMYDVVRRSYTKDSVTYYAWWDHEETELNQKLDRLTASLFEKSPEKKRSSQHFSFFLTQLFIEFHEVLFQPRPIDIGKDYFAYNELLSEPFISISTPPPATYI